MNKRKAEEEVAELKAEVKKLRGKVDEMQEELEELREYKAQKEQEEEEEEDDEDPMKYWDFACCKHIDASESKRDLYACPSYDVYCTECKCSQPNSYGDFEVVGEYWWRCEECSWQNGNAYKLLCGDCVEWRNNPKSCAHCSDKADGPDDLTDFNGDELCKDCLEAAIDEAKPRCEWCNEKEEEVGPLKEHGEDKEKMCVKCMKEYDEEQQEDK